MQYTDKHVTEHRVEGSGQALLHVPTEKVALPHSFSSPELPVPSNETSTSSLLVTLHNTPLVSPSSRTSDVTNIVLPVPTVHSSTCLDSEGINFQLHSQSKKYRRSNSELLSSYIEGCSQFRDPIQVSQNIPWSKSSPLFSLHERTLMTAQDQSKAEKRSRSLSPYLSRCLCYNCNVSKLILQSRDLPPVERSNFNTYFARSLSHKFFNCSCYLNLHQDASNRSSCSVSSNDSCGNAKESHLMTFQSNPCSVCTSRKEAQFEIGQNLDSCSPESTCDHPYMHKHPVSRKKEKSMVDRRVIKSIFNGGSIVQNSRTPTRTISCPNLSTTSDILPSDASRYLFKGPSASSRIRKRWSCTRMNVQWYSSLIDLTDHSSMFHYTSSMHDNDVHVDHDIPRKSSHRFKCPRASFSRLQPQRSFSSPDTRPSIIQPDPTCTARRHRHSISGQMSYFKLLGYNVNKKLTGSANSLFSTAVISGSSSAPNLKDMVPSHTSAVAGK